VYSPFRETYWSSSLAASSSILGFLKPSPEALRNASYSDVFLVFGVISIVVMMVLPMPIWLIDTLVAVNICIGIGLVLIAIYIPSPVAFSSFPSVLMLTTLFRLSLSVAITRKILLEADGGHIIDTFGRMVAGGNLIVGLVVFLIITVVQFIVVAKGAERVAEVSARFTLDAMPGKQLSIDSDLRSGLVDKDEAKRRRKLLETESQMHGALDGAMKFVKGDAIAGIVIIIINLLGGLGIGMIQRDMELSAAIQTYSILTIGDGLVAQIPALLAAVAAGLIVTRGSGDDQNKRHLGAEISAQISGEPRVPLILGVMLILFSLVPGFPAIVFIAIGLGFIAIGLWSMRSTSPALQRLFRSPVKPAAPTGAAKLADLDVPPALQLDIDPALLAEAGATESLSAYLDEFVGRSRGRMGTPLPLVTIRTILTDRNYVLSAHGVSIAIGSVPANRYFLPIPAERKSELIPAWPGTFGAQQPGALNVAEFLRAHLTMAINRQLSVFIGIQETSNLVAQFGREYPELIKELFRALSPQKIADVLKRLVEEQVSIRHLRDVFEALTDAAQREKNDMAMLTELTRVGMKRHISANFSGKDRVLRCVLVHPEFEDRLRGALRNTPTGPQLAMDPETSLRFLEEIRKKRPADGVWDQVLLCTTDVRRHIRRLTESEFFDLPVLSYQELTADLKVVRLGQVSA
jgi:type III secretion protein V